MARILNMMNFAIGLVGVRYSMCYTIGTNERRKSYDSLDISLPPKFVKDNRLMVYAHDEGDEFWLLKDVWPNVKQKSEQIKGPGDITVIKKVVT